ncbi:MAG: hypothetical protein ACI8PZ_004108 [Myxococcota bacterium]|jgi:hypothetical protein
MPDPHVKMAQFTLSDPLPAEAVAIAQIAMNVVIKDIVAGRVSYLVLLTFNGSTGRIWQLHDPPMADDVVRAIIQRESPDAIAFVHPQPLPPEVEGERGYNVAVEAPSGKFDCLIALWGGEGLGGEMMRIYGRSLEGVDHRWLGVPPEGEVEMWFEGIVGAIGDVAEA